MQFKHLILFLVFISALSGFAQKPKKEKKKKERVVPENIETFPRNFMIRPRYVYPQVWIDVSSRLRGRGDHFRYKAAMPGLVGLTLKIKKVTISGAVKIPSNTVFKDKYGNTDFRDIFINIQGRIVGWNLYYRDYKGFYLDDYQTFYPEWNLDSLGYPKAPNLQLIETGLTVGFSFNKNFSMNAAFAQGERQKKSAGSFLLGISERYQRINTDSTFIPYSAEGQYPNIERLLYGNFISTIISFGCGYQFVINKIHFTPVILAGTGFQIQNYQQTNRHRSRVNIPAYANFRSQLGYNGDNFFVNLIYQTEYNSIPIKESRLRLYHNWLEFGIGVRF